MRRIFKRVFALFAALTIIVVGGPVYARRTDQFNEGCPSKLGA